MYEKLKVVWICHFSNKEIQSKLPLWKEFDEFASWISNTIVGFEKRKDIELHIVAPHIYLKYDTSFILRGIHYHFLNFGFPIINRPWPSFFALDALCGYPYLRRKIVNIVSHINPNIVNLQGAENAYYSSSIVDLKMKYPCVITIQGFACHMQNKKSTINKRRIATENTILKNFKYFYLDATAILELKKYSSEIISKVIWWPAAETIIENVPEVKFSERKYDILYCGRMEQSKGVEDFIKIVEIIKHEKADIRAAIIGSCLPKYSIYLKKMALKLNCLDNIDFIGFVPTQKEMFSYFRNSKVLLVPTLIDRYPSTIREALRLEIPVVAYKTGSIPWTNRSGENIILVEHANFVQMASKTEVLLKNKSYMDTIVKAGRKFYEEEFSCDKNVDRFISGYHEIISDFNCGKKVEL